MNDTIWVLEKKRQSINGKTRNVIQLTKYKKRDFVFHDVYTENFLYQSDPKWLIKLKKKLNAFGYGNVFAKQEGSLKRREIHDEMELEQFLLDIGIDITKSHGYSKNLI